MFLIVGLGNPGARYRSTYHNLGFMVADAFARANKLRFTGRECDAVTAKGRVGGSEVVVAKPQTFIRRLKIGIATARFAERGVDIADFVLSRIDYADKKTIEECVETAASALADLASGADIMRVEERINRRKQPR